MLDGYTWDMTGYIRKHGYLVLEKGMTTWEADRIFQLDPAPPEMELNDYILAALREKNLTYFSFFLHHYEWILNERVYAFRCRDGYDRYDPERVVDMKIACMEAILTRLPHYDPDKGAAFTTYIYKTLAILNISHYKICNTSIFTSFLFFMTHFIILRLNY